MSFNFKPLWALALLAGAFCLSGGSPVAADTGSVEIQLLSVSDWRGQIDPLSDPDVGPVGGAAVLSAYWQADRAKDPNSLTLTAGDAFGGSPPLSNLFADEPAAFAIRMMGIDVDTLGNQNFNSGLDILQRLIAFTGVQYVSADLTNLNANNLSNVHKFEIVDVGGVKVGVIGLTNPEAPTQVFPGYFGSMQVSDPLIAARTAREEAAKAGAQVFVLIAHLGVDSVDPITNAASGQLIDLAQQLDGYDAIFGSNTDVQFSGRVNGALVVQNRSQGRTYTRTNLSFDKATGRVTKTSVDFVSPTTKGVTPDARIEARMAPYRKELNARLAVTVAGSSAPIPRTDVCGRSDSRFCESAAGNVVADAMRAAYATDFAITNSGGIRADITCPPVGDPGDFCPGFAPPPYPVTQGQLEAVLPFGNIAATVSVNGTELKSMLENGVSMMPAADGRFPQVAGLCFAYDIAAPVGSRVTSVSRQGTDGSCGATKLDLTPAASYSLVINDFMAAGGDDYPKLTAHSVTRDPMDEVLRRYVGTHPSLAPVIQGRIVCSSSGSVACPALVMP